MVEVFCQEMPNRVCIVSNGTYPLKRFDKLFLLDFFGWQREDS